MVLCFALSTALSAAAFALGWEVWAWPQQFAGGEWMAFGLAVLIGVAIGYYASRRFVRQVDALQIGLIQMSRGNLSQRLPVSGRDPFDPVFRDFNQMAESMEQRIQWLQKLGEENVMLQAASNEAAVIEERRRLARDLHDTVSQQLFAMHMTASALPQMIERDPQQAAKLIEQLIGVSQHAQRQMRGLISQLRPIELEGRSLQQALDRWFPDYCRQNQLQGTLDLDIGVNVKGAGANGSGSGGGNGGNGGSGKLASSSAEAMPEAIEHQMFLLIQEGMANVVKHSEATRVTLSLRDTGRQYSLKIEDNGAGFDTSAVKAGSYGLATMKERAEKLGGSFEIASRPGMGASLKVRIPKFKR
ncbi:MAG: signal transduction histidine kinase [Paenibacillaceae bacterium]|jgi:NarL family two-component system sensor histidine kinase LiaS|nr:signal transduction histidine kinase [Paenibacillaceae bacterium]